MRDHDHGSIASNWVLVLATAALVIPVSFFVAEDVGLAGMGSDDAASEDRGELDTASQEACSDKWTPDPDWANARSRGQGLLIRTAGGVADDRERTLHTAVNLSGVGERNASDHLETLSVGDPTGAFDTLASYELGNATSHVDIDSQPGFGVSEQTATVTLSNLNLLDGLVTADKVKSVSSTDANSSQAGWSSTGTQFTGLTVDGEEIADVQPWQMVDLSDRFGNGSRVMLYERIGSVHAPDDPVNDGWASDLTVNAIHVYLRDVDMGTEGLQTIDIVISQAKGHTDFPMEPPCGPSQRVGADATALNASLPAQQPLITGYARIPFTGGHESTAIGEVEIAGNDLEVVKSEVHGGWETDRSWANASSKVADLCLWQDGGDCLVEGTAIGSTALASASSTPATVTGTTTIWGLTVAGEDLCDQIGLVAPCSPPPNTEITLPDGSTLVLNEQVTDEASTDCKSSITVRGLHLIPSGDDPELVVAESHADAAYCSR